MIKKYLSIIPIPMAGVALGISALGNLIQNLSTTLRGVCGILSTLLILMVIARLLICHETNKAEFQNPIIASVSATVCMTLMQLSAYAYPHIGTPAFVIWIFAISLHLALILFYTKKFMFHFRLKEVYPTCFITYVGIIVSSITSTTFHMEFLGQIMFWFGFACYMLLLAIITLRYIRHERELASKPLLCIYAAPMSLSIVGYLAVTPHVSIPFVITLEVFAQLLFLMVLTQLPKYLKLPFFPSYAAFTFPFVITAFALQKTLALLASLHTEIPMLLTYITRAEIILAIVLVTYTMIRFLHHIAKHWKIVYRCSTPSLD